MLISRIVLAIGKLSAASLPLVDFASNASRSTRPNIGPGEPSTIAEALIAVTLIAAYLLFGRRVRGRRSVLPVSKPTRAGRGRKAA